MNLKELRSSKNLTQQETAILLGMSRRGYQELEYKNNDNSLSYKYAVEKLNNYNAIDEDHGILSINFIKEKCSDVFKDKDIDFAILFGSYAKNKAIETSDVDILISTNISGLEFYGLVEELRETLNKKIDLITTKMILQSNELLLEILKDGIKIYDNNKK